MSAEREDGIEVLKKSRRICKDSVKRLWDCAVDLLNGYCAYYFFEDRERYAAVHTKAIDR